MAASADPKGVTIQRDAVYDLPALRQLGWGTHALRQARRKHGLKIRRLGRKSWVLGSDLIELIENTATLVK
ncbi:MAG: hypothetical protein IT424_03470 [Pirellulales bacterium]|nr:hypothetical protein [Pirellulales bacterium]